MQAAASSQNDPYVGLSFDDQFRIEQAIGVGAMARVYRARQLGIERDVAIKILKRELLGMPEVLLRFRREAELAARLLHPNIVVVHSVGRVPLFGPELGGEPYTALEYLDGPSLAQLLEREGGRLPLGRALHIVLSVCDAVGEAHARGIVHRDLKPENVLLVKRGDDTDFVKLLDFGLAKAQKSAVDLQTRAGAVLGTPRYVSPEGALGEAVGAPGDCYGLATLLYQCLAGRTPFLGPDALTLLSEHASAEPPELRSHPSAADVPAPIAEVIMQNLAKRPEARAPDARAFGRALVDAARRARLGAEEIGLSSTLLGSHTTQRDGGVRVLSLATPVASAPSPELRIPESISAQAPRSRSSLGARESDPELKARRRRAHTLRRAATFVACFFFGIAAALAIAAGFGAFEAPPATESP